MENIDKYEPIFDITNEMIELCLEISENLGKLSNVNELDGLPRLRKVSRLKSIYSSLAIEQNKLSIKEVSDVINGKRVIGKKNDITAVKNAFKAYNELGNFDPFSKKELLRIHSIMMNELVEEAGKIRSTNVGVFDNLGNAVHIAPPYSLVNDLIDELFKWVKESEIQMLIKSSIFHYEFEFIHPFRDGNGRMGRLWQNALLVTYKPIFKYVPIESVIKDNQNEYYDAIKKSSIEGKCNKFILFMLNAINKAVKDLLNETNNHLNHLSININKLMEVMETYPQSAQMIMKRLNLKSRVGFRRNYLIPALEAGIIKMTIPDKPTSKNQLYYKI